MLKSLYDVHLTLVRPMVLGRERGQQPCHVMMTRLPLQIVFKPFDRSSRLFGRGEVWTLTRKDGRTDRQSGKWIEGLKKGAVCRTVTN